MASEQAEIDHRRAEQACRQQSPQDDRIAFDGHVDEVAVGNAECLAVLGGHNDTAEVIDSPCHPAGTGRRSRFRRIGGRRGAHGR